VGGSLVDAAARNLALSRELTQTANPPARGAEAILTDIAQAMEGIAAVAHRHDEAPTQEHARNPER
jgi:hypothetical protein